MNNSNHRPTLCVVVTLLALSLTHLAPSKSFATLLAHDNFDYTNIGGNLQRSFGGSGFTSPWALGGFNASLSTNYKVGYGSLSYPGIVSTGNSATTTSNNSITGLTRRFNQSLGAPGTTRYMSFLMRPEGIVGQGQFNGFFGLVLEQPGDPEIMVSKPGGGSLFNYGIENRGGSNQVATSTPVVAGETSLFVLKTDFTAGNDQFTLYMNPTAGLPEPSVASATRFASVPSVQGITLYSTGAFSFDEFRMGETYADVVPVPEPVGGLGLAFVAVSFLVLRRRKK